MASLQGWKELELLCGPRPPMLTLQDMHLDLPCLWGRRVYDAIQEPITIQKLFSKQGL